MRHGVPDPRPALRTMPDINDLIRIFHDALGGPKHYAPQPRAVKHICCGLRHSLILRKVRTVSQLRKHLETMEW